MNDAQRISQIRRSVRLLWLSYVLLVPLTGTGIAVAAVLLANYMGLTESVWRPTVFALIFVAVFSVVALIGSVIRLKDIKQGGKLIARKIKAKPVLGNSGFGTDRTLFDIVAELARKTSLQMPTVWVMPDETVINAFTLGYKNDIAMVVTQGALEILDKEELEGLMAHEFGHLSQSDLTLNMHLMASKAGLLSINKLGRRLCAGGKAGKLVQWLHPKFLLGVCLRILGWPGKLAAIAMGKSLSQPSSSRASVLLADLCAVQYTRTRFGIASAMEKIIETNEDAGLESLYSSELSHLCFHSPTKKLPPASWFSTHPTLRARMQGIDPAYAIKKGKIDDLGNVQVRDVPAYRSQISPIYNGASPMTLGDSDLTDKFELYVDKPIAALAVIFAMFVKNDPVDANHFYDAVAFAYQKPFSKKVKEVREALGHEIDGNTLAVLDNVRLKLVDVKLENKRALLRNIEKLIEAEGGYNLRNHALLQYVRQVLDVEFPVLMTIANADKSKATKSKLKTLPEMENELSLLLTLIVEASGASPEQQERDYRRLLKNYTQNDVPRRSRQHTLIAKELDNAYQSLYAQPLTVRQSFVSHCGDIARRDGQPINEEKVFLEIFAASLHIRATHPGEYRQHLAA